MLLQKFDNITGEQAHWIKYGTWSYKKMKKKKKILAKIELKYHSAG